MRAVVFVALHVCAFVAAAACASVPVPVQSNPVVKKKDAVDDVVPKPPPLGLYALDDKLKNGTYPTLPPFIQGVTVRLNWKDLQPAEDTYNWTVLDASIERAAALGIKVMLGIMAGEATPHWVYDAGAKPFYMLWDLPFSHPNCSEVAIPIPWDEVFLEKHAQFVQALGERYDSNDHVSAVKLVGINGQTQELLLPNKNVTDCHNGTVWDPTDEWLRVGYLPQKIKATWAKVLSLYQQAFATTTKVVMAGAFPWPGIDEKVGPFIHWC